jgi:lipopolysaccharide transport system permease protein
MQPLITDEAEPPEPTQQLRPEVPLVTIEPTRSWLPLNVSDLWTYRELLYFLIWRDLKVRYKQTFLGVGWVVTQPLLTTLIFTVFLGVLARVPTGGMPYSLLVFSGLLPWTFFSTAVIGCSFSLVGNANLITKVYFPRVLMPVASVGARLVDFAISLAILEGLILYYGITQRYHVALSWKLATLPLMVVLMTLLTLACGILASCLNVKYRDVGVALPVLIQLWMFVSPVIYPLRIVPQKWRMIYFLNPIAGLVEGFRSALLGTELDRLGLALSAIVTIVLLVCSAFIFPRTERSFADVV